MNRQSLLMILALVVYAVSLRLLPHPANFAPLTALAIFSGSKLPRRQAIGTVLAAAVLSDAIIGFYDFGTMATVWACYAVIALASHNWFKRPTWRRGLVVVLGSSAGFFVATNLAVWLSSGLYPHSLAGLQNCFTLALPFWRNSLAGDLFYAVNLFGLAEWASILSHSSKLTVVQIN